MHRKNLDLFVVVIIAVLNIVWRLLQGSAPAVGIILALPLALALPGYTLTEVLFHKRPINAPERLVLSFGLSLAIDILGGLFLNLFPGGLQAAWWAVLLGLLTVTFSLLGAYFRRGMPVNGSQPLKFRLNVYQAILFGLATLVVTLSFVYVNIGIAQQPHPGFTQLWMLPDVQSGKSCAVRLGVRSFELVPVSYHLAITINGDQVAAVPSIFLDPQKEWNRLVPVTPTTADEIYVEVRLYRIHKPGTVYREVHLTFHNLSKSNHREVRLCGTPPAKPTSILASTYSGTVYDMPANLATSLALIRIQQSGRNITGYFTTGKGVLGSGSFRGTIISTQVIRLIVTDDTGHAILLFEGGVQTGGSLSGNYCGLDQKGHCSSSSNYGYGLWSVVHER